MAKDTKKVPLREAIALNWRGMKLLYTRTPHFYVLSIIHTVWNAATPYIGIWLSAQIVNELAGARRPDVLWRWVWLALGSAALIELIGAALNRWKGCHGGSLWWKHQKIYNDKLLDMDYCVYEDQHTHDLFSQIKQNANWSNWGLGRVGEYFSSLVSAVVRIVGAIALTVSLFTQRVPDGSALAWLNHPLFFVALVAVMLTITYVSPTIGNWVSRQNANQAASTKLGNRVFTFWGWRVTELDRALDVRIYNQQALSRHYYWVCDTYFPGGPMDRFYRGIGGLMRILENTLSVIFTGVVYLFVCLKAWAGAFGVGSVTQYIGAITNLSSGVKSLISTLGGMQNNAVFLRTTFEFLDLPNPMYQGSLTTEKRSDRKYEVEFRDVSFKYPGSDSWALRHVSMKFNIGRRLAVVGPNGSGKTTFIKLLCRLYDPTEGEILLNGIDIRKYDYRDYLGIFSVVCQDFKLLSLPLGQNVAASRTYDAARVTDCLEKAGFSDRLAAMPEGLGTYLYHNLRDDGVEVSGGEAQKIAIARALYKNAPFIILDEPTAALDPIAEAEIYAKFSTIVDDRTAIYISHRLSSCRFCDEIAVFDGGCVVQMGCHDSLVEADGLYRDLWFAQAQYYEKKAE